MKFLSVSTVILTVSLISCKKEIEIKKVNHKKMTVSSQKINVNVVNTEDPICHMKTSNFLKDTVNYKGKIYGFCSTYCKDEFKRLPQKYIIK